jgi:hypothetical protein
MICCGVVIHPLSGDKFGPVTVTVCFKTPDSDNIEEVGDVLICAFIHGYLLMHTRIAGLYRRGWQYEEHVDCGALYAHLAGRTEKARIRSDPCVSLRRQNFIACETEQTFECPLLRIWTLSTLCEPSS